MAQPIEADTTQASEREREERERRLDTMLADSFPASDPSSSWAGEAHRRALAADDR